MRKIYKDWNDIFSLRPFSTKVLAAVLVILTFLAYSNVLSYPFVHDDLVFIRHNPQISSFKDWGTAFLRSSSPDAGSALAVINPYYRPVLEIFYKIQYKFFRFDPSGYHLFNVGLHAINGILLFALIYALTKRRIFSWVLAAVFLVHPVQTETVACISGVSNLLSSFSVLTAFLFCAKAFSEGKRTFLVYAIAAGLFYVMAVFTKEQAVIFPLLFFLYEYSYSSSKGNGRKERRKKVWGLLGGFVLVAAAYFLWRKVFLGKFFPSLWDYQQELLLRILAIPQTLLMYGRILLFPYDLHYYRSVDILRLSSLAPVVFVFVCVGAVALIRFLPKEKRRLLLFGVGWFLLSLLPMMNFVPLIHEYSLIAAFEHFLYLPMVGFLLFVFVAGEHFVDSRWKARAKIVKIILLTLALGVCLGLTIKQNAYWRGEVPLFQRAVRHEKHFGRLQALLAKAYYFEKNYDAAEEEFRQALGIMQGYARRTSSGEAQRFYWGFIKGIHFDLAHVYEAKNAPLAAIGEYEKALVIDPKDGIIHNNVGMIYLMLSDFGKAREHFEKSITFEPNHLLAKNNLAVCLIQQGKRDEAECLLREILASDSHSAVARQNLESLLRDGLKAK